MPSSATEAGLAFVAALDDASVAQRTERLRRLVAPGATWWVDTGRDRLAGRHGHDPRDRRGWPLHGTIPMDEKLEIVARFGPSLFPKGLGRRVATRAFGGDRVALVEAYGDGEHRSGKRYRNRYAFVFELDGDRIVAVREYLDTLHAEDVLGDERPSRRTEPEAPAPRAPLEPGTGAEELALALWPALADGDLSAFGRLFAPGATWWTDTGLDRERGGHDADSGLPRRWPLHGVVPIAEKLAYISARREEGYRSAVTVTPTRCVSEARLVLVEAEGYARLANGLAYGNRYAFLVETAADGIRQVREYCDTLHIADVMGLDTHPNSQGG